MKKQAICSLSIIFSVFFMAYAFGASFVSHNEHTHEVEFYQHGGFAAVSDDCSVCGATEVGEDTNFTELYFGNLNRGYYGYNEYGTCGYIAIGMLLSYYDTFWNDNIISENYENNVAISSTDVETYVNSPGTVEKINSGADFFDYIYNQNDVYFNSHLLKLAMDLGYYEEQNSKISFAHTYFYQIYDVLKKHFATDSKISQYEYAVGGVNHELDYNSIVPGKNYTYSKQLRQDVIGYVKQGIPVLVALSGETPESEGHALIAYDYDASTDTIYGHFGWADMSKQYNHKDIESMPYNNISAYAVINKGSIQHEHSNNLILNGTGVCSCILSNHVHEDTTFLAITNNEHYHKSICYCGYVAIKNHDFRVVGNNSVCTKCRLIKPYDGKRDPITITPNNLVDDVKTLKKGGNCHEK